MARGPHRITRALALTVLLALATSACQIDVRLNTTVERDGSGRFSLRFVIDKELVDLARNSGEDPFAALGEFPEELTRAGWVIRRSTEGGGLVIDVQRAFRDAGDLNRALDELERQSAAQEGPTAKFFRLRIDRSSSFLRTKTSIEGTIDLTSSGLLGAADLPAESASQLQSLIEQAADQFFRFTVRAELPGKVSSTAGDPEAVRGGVAEWAPRLGKTLEFRASSSAYNPVAFAAIGGPVLLVLALLLWTLLRRRRLAAPAPVEGFAPLPPPPADQDPAGTPVP